MPVPPLPANEAWLTEIFSSIQGEGPWVGVRQMFIRFSGCNWDCSYCDTCVEKQEFCRVEWNPGCGRFEEMPNPVALSFVARLAAEWKISHPRAYHSISLTGGEPLCHDKILLEWLPQLKTIMPIYLETNGTLPVAMQKLLPFIDFVAMDIKLSSVTGKTTPWEEHRQFLVLAGQRPCCVKVVVSDKTCEDELIQTAGLVQANASQAPLVLQPLSENGKIEIPADKLMRMQEIAAGIHSDVRVISQNHLFLNLL